MPGVTRTPWLSLENADTHLEALYTFTHLKLARGEGAQGPEKGVQSSQACKEEEDGISGEDLTWSSGPQRSSEGVSGGVTEPPRAALKRAWWRPYERTRKLGSFNWEGLKGYSLSLNMKMFLKQWLRISKGTQNFRPGRNLGLEVRKPES